MSEKSNPEKAAAPPRKARPQGLEKAAEEAVSGSAAVEAVLLQETLDRGHIEKKLGLPTGFFKSLRDQGSDWEFSIKLVVLLEAALGHVLAARLANEAVRNHCERLNLGGGRVSKLGLAEDLGVLTSTEQKAFSALANIRNTFAHRVENIAGDLETYAKSMQEKDFVACVKTVMMVPPEVAEDVAFLWRPQSEQANLFRYFMWSGASLLLNVLAKQDKHAEAEEERRKNIERMAAAFRGELPGGLGQFFGLNLGGGPLSRRSVLGGE